MSVNQLMKDASDVCQKLWGSSHNASVQGEVSYMCTHFEQGSRAQEFDHLLHTSHMVNEANDTDLSVKLHDTQPEKIVSKIEAIATMIDKIVTTDNQHSDKYLSDQRAVLQSDLDQCRRDIERKKAEVDQQFNSRLNQLQIQFSQNQ